MRGAIVGARPAIGCAQATSFLARTSGLNATHTNAYRTLICGLVNDGVWAKLDALYMLATQNSMTALLNLVSASFPLVVHGSPAFVADKGYTGASDSSVWLDTGYTESTASLNLTLDSAHLSVWQLTDTGAGGVPIGADDLFESSFIAPNFGGATNYVALNSTFDGAGGGPSAIGFWVSSRINPSVIDVYKDGSVLRSPSVSSVGLVTMPFYILARDDNGTVIHGDNNQTAVVSVGGGLTSGNVTALYTRLQTYLQAVGAI